MKTCHHYLESLSKIDDSKFLFLRYEDMSRDQLSTAKNVYDFIERPMSKKLLKWIDESTKVHGTIGGAYSTIRNSTLTMTAWRHKITFAEVSYYFGYQILITNVGENFGDRCFTLNKSLT